MKTKIYIIGNIPSKIDKECEDKFYKTQIHFLQMGFNVINPIARLTSKELTFNEAKRKNIHDLMLCSAVYIMPCVELIKGVENLEIKLANDFNLVVISSMFDLNPEEKISSKNRKLLKKANAIIDL